MEENNNLHTDAVNENVANYGVGYGENAGEMANGIPTGGFTVASNLPTKVSVWTKIKNFLFQDITVELTPKQQKVEDEINEFLHQEITFAKIHDFLFQEISFGKKNK